MFDGDLEGSEGLIDGTRGEIGGFGLRRWGSFFKLRHNGRGNGDIEFGVGRGGVGSESGAKKLTKTR